MCICLVTPGVTSSTPMTNVLQVDETCKLLAPGAEGQTAVHQLEVFTLEYGPVFIDLITMKVNF